MTACPGNETSVTVVVEDATAAGDDAAFIAMTVDRTPGTTRDYNLTRAFGADGASDAAGAVFISPMWAFPEVGVQSSSGAPPGTTITNAYRNVDINIHEVGPAAGQTVTAYEVFAVHAAAPPGRARSNWGAPVSTIPYTGQQGTIPDSIQVPCPTATDDTYVAVGLVYDSTVPSFYVGKHTRVECDPSVADPDVPSEIRRPRPNLPRGGTRRSGR
jgi:hypothetical protein